MVGRWLFQSVVALALAACSGSEAPSAAPPAPDNLIPEAQFTELLLEMHLIEGARGGTSLMGDSIPVWKIYAGTFARLGYSQDQVAQSYAYYHANPKLMVAMYTEVMKRLEATQTPGTP